MYLAQTTVNNRYWFFSTEKAAGTTDLNVVIAFTNLGKNPYKPSAYHIAGNTIIRPALNKTTPFAIILCKIPNNIKEDNYLDYLQDHHPELFL